MNKKLKAILIIGILLLTGLSAVSIVGGKQNIECFQTEGWINIIYPPDGATVSGIVPIMLYIYGNINRVEFYIDDSPELVDFTPPYELFWDTTEEPDGYHEIKVIAYDHLGNSASDSILVIVNNENTEPWLDGPFNGKVGEEYTYCIRGTEDIEAEGLYASFDWGDGTYTGWIGPYLPGEDICAPKIWDLPGSYLLVVQLKNESDLWIDAWGGYVTIEKKSKPTFNLLFLQFLERFPFLERLLNLL